MKLLNSFVSPFASRVRLAIYAHDLPVEIAPSGQWTEDFQKSPDYLAINPIGRVPTLILGDGSALPESTVIVEYLADAFPNVGLRPRNAEAAAKDRLLAHLIEIYVQERANPLFPQVFAKQRDADKILATVAAMNTGLSHLNHFMEGESYRADRAITTADCALIVYLFFFADCMVRALDQPAIIANHPRIAAYWRAMQDAPAAQRVIGEMRTAIAQSPLKMLVSSPDRTAREQQVTT
jgi:glutathione S-transferase